MGGRGNKCLISIREEQMKDFLQWNPRCIDDDDDDEVKFADIVKNIEDYNLNEDIIPHKTNYLYEIKEFFTVRLLLFCMRYTDGNLYNFIVEKFIESRKWSEDDE